MKRNRTVRIGYRNYGLKFVARVDKENSMGECDYEKGVIKIRKDLTGIELANTIAHEINHAILHDRGVNLSYEDDELVVMSITNGQAAFLKDNPAFCRMLIKAARED